MNLPFQIELQPPVAIISISGKILTQEDTHDIMEEIGNAEKSVQSIVMDVSELSYCSSAGLGFFVRCLTRTKIAGGKFVICGINGNVEKLFAISKLNEIFTFCPDKESGLNFINAN